MPIVRNNGSPIANALSPPASARSDTAASAFPEYRSASGSSDGMGVVYRGGLRIALKAFGEAT
ncbi:hypothetical protein OJ996_03575 [Luteolibacter sp. GHJ8]|uniref:Uncharacterized protein n=1 Tax=Luteolibacter rhizosphaerae TaxID=2989719 RepID=A0ABT3FYH3_9BACT|nr:hypothetical protein [Luteolibacter rhizosphaerae]MCW1912640.1 hypothetical protein [Luteolibacter rhizosphaerae]